MDNAPAEAKPPDSPPPPASKSGAMSATASTPRAAAVPGKAFDPQTTALCIEAIKQLRVGLSQALLYTLETKQFEKAREAVYEPLTALLNNIGSFTLNITHGEPLINGQRVEIPAPLRSIAEYIEKIMKATGVNSLRFDPGMSSDELGKFLQLLSRKKFASSDGAKINEFLREQGIQRIQTGELRYVVIGSQDRIVSGGGGGGGAGGGGGGGGLASHSVAQMAVGGVSDAYLETIDHVQDPEARQQLRAEMTEQLIQKDSEMLGNMLAAATKHLKTAGPEYRDLVALPQRDSKMLIEALQLARLLNEKGVLESEECMRSMRNVIEELAAPYQSRAEDILGLLKFDPSVKKLLPEWLIHAYKAMQGGSAMDRLEGILTQSPHALLDEEMFHQIVDVLDELSVAALDAEAERLTVHIAGALRSVTKGERTKAVQRLSFLLERSMEQSSQPVQVLENALLDACTHETCDEVMQLLLDHLSKRCIHHYKQEYHERALEHLRWITSLEGSSRVAMRDEGVNLACKTREQMGKSEFAGVLAQDLLAGDAKARAAIAMAQILGKDVWLAIIGRIRAEKDETQAAALAARLKEIGKEALQLFLAQLSGEADGATTARLLSLVIGLGDDTVVWPEIPKLLRHSHAAVMTRALEFVMSRDGQNAVDVLAGLLRGESDTSRRSIWIGSLAQLRDPGALQILLEELETARTSSEPDEELLVALLHAFAQMDKQEIIPVILRLLAPPKGRTLMLGPEGARPSSKPVTLAAMRALARFYKVPAVAEILERARKDKDPDISRLALVSARGIVAAEQIADEKLAGAATSSLASAVQAKPAAPARKTRRFEVLEAQVQLDMLFKPGATIGAPQPAAAAPPKPSGTELNTTISLQDIRPALEGQLQDLGLATTLGMLGGKDGLLRINGLEGEARLLVKARTVVGAAYAGKTGMEALARIESVKAAQFAYFPRAVADEGLSVPIDKLLEQLQQYRDKHDEGAFF